MINYNIIIQKLIDNYDITIIDWYDRVYMIQCKKCKIENTEICNCYDAFLDSENLTETSKYNKPTECKKYNIYKLIYQYNNYIDLNILNYKLCETILNKIIKKSNH